MLGSLIERIRKERGITKTRVSKANAELMLAI